MLGADDVEYLRRTAVTLDLAIGIRIATLRERSR